MTGRLADKVAIVTGGNSGMGAGSDSTSEVTLAATIVRRGPTILALCGHAGTIPYLFASGLPFRHVGHTTTRASGPGGAGWRECDRPGGRFGSHH